MTQQHTVEVLLRPAVELYTVAVCLLGIGVCLFAPWVLGLTPLFGAVTALLYLALGWCRPGSGLVPSAPGADSVALSPQYPPPAALCDHQPLHPGQSAATVCRHRFQMGTTPYPKIDADYRPEFRRYVDPAPLFQQARRLERRLEHATFPWSLIPRLTAWDSPLNPVRPLPPVGGSARLHGVEPHEVEVSLPLGERVGHSLVLGTTRVGKTRLAELFITQDIRRVKQGDAGPEFEPVIVFDPKGDADLLKRMYVEARRAGREKEFHVFHLGWPDVSARYNAVGRFGRISEVASRISGQLSGEGSSAAFREFAWRFVNIIARALVELGTRPDYLKIQQHVINIDALFIDYSHYYFTRHEPDAWESIASLEGKLNEKNTPHNLRG